MTLASTNCRRRLFSDFLRLDLRQREFSSSSRRQDHYDTLGVPPQATKAQIKSNFYQLSKQHHPDVSKNPQSRDIFHAVTQAYAILSDDRQRRAYDRNQIQARVAAAHASPKHRPSTEYTYTEWSERRRRTVHHAWEFSTRPGSSQHRPPPGWQQQHTHPGPQQHRHPGQHYRPAPAPSSDPSFSPRPYTPNRKQEAMDFARDELRKESSALRALQLFAVMLVISLFGTGWGGKQGYVQPSSRPKESTTSGTTGPSKEAQ